MIKKGFHGKIQIDKKSRIVMHTVKKNSVSKSKQTQKYFYSYVVSELLFDPSSLYGYVKTELDIFKVPSFQSLTLSETPTYSLIIGQLPFIRNRNSPKLLIVVE